MDSLGSELGDEVVRNGAHINGSHSSREVGPVPHGSPAQQLHSFGGTWPSSTTAPRHESLPIANFSLHAPLESTVNENSDTLTARLHAPGKKEEAAALVLSTIAPKTSTHC